VNSPSSTATTTATVARPTAGGVGPIAYARDLRKTYGAGDTAVHAFAGIDVDFSRGELTAIMGPSDSGKSTLMHRTAGLDRATSGSVVVDGAEVSAMNERHLTKLRRTRLGFIFQAYNLVPTLTPEENITLSLDIARLPVDRAYLDEVVAAAGGGVNRTGSAHVS
jgi:putative ABC transport system ATP-binding protein